MAKTSTGRSANGSEVSVLSQGARIRGRIHGTGALRVEGSVEGDVSVGGDLEVAEGGAITGDVAAAAVTVGGALTGDVAARGAVAIRASARVEGNMGGSEVSLEEGAVFAGRIDADFELPPQLAGKR